MSLGALTLAVVLVLRAVGLACVVRVAGEDGAAAVALVVAGTDGVVSESRAAAPAGVRSRAIGRTIAVAVSTIQMIPRMMASLRCELSCTSTTRPGGELQART